jgi:hypothetical protein
MPRQLTGFVILLTLSALAVPCSAEWPPNGAALCTASGSQNSVCVARDETGGAIVAWQDWRSGGRIGIYAQRVDADGSALWAPDGVLVILPPEQVYLSIARIVGDGAGGAIVAWIQDEGGIYGVHAQRLDAAGALQWGPSGTPVGSAGGLGDYLEMAPDGLGGAILAWQDAIGTGSDVLAQRLAHQGYVQWGGTGVLMSSAEGDQREPAVMSDGAGGAIVAWSETRGASYDVYAQKIRADGTTAWASDGVGVCAASNGQSYPVLVGDGAGGAIVAWEDARSVNYVPDIYAQRIDAGGAPLWATDGVPICSASGDQWSPRIAGDLAGGAYLAWTDHRTGGNDIYAQRVRGNGAVAWAADGLAVCAASGAQWAPQLVTESGGSAILAWQDERADYGDIYAQMCDPDGNATWAPNGLAVCTASGGQAYPQLVSHAARGAILAWEDGRGGADSDIYANAAIGETGGVEPPPVAHQSWIARCAPNPFVRSTEILLRVPERGPVALNVYDAGGHLVARLAGGTCEPGWRAIAWDGSGIAGRRVGPGTYFYRLTAGRTVLTNRMVLLR